MKQRGDFERKETGRIWRMIREIVGRIQSAIRGEAFQEYDPSLNYEYCPRCEANLTLQKGYDNALPYWKCLGCGEMLINPAVDSDSGIVWVCDKCGAMLNIQQGFQEECGKWKCAECGFVNEISTKEVYDSDDEYQAERRNPYRGMKDEDILKLSFYEEVEFIGHAENVILVKEHGTGKLFVKKILYTFDTSVYRYLLDHPMDYMPGIYELYEGEETLVVIEEYIRGKTLEELLDSGPLELGMTIEIGKKLCEILDCLHHLDPPIVHRDLKPSNVMISPDGEVWLLDMNVAKWYNPSQKDDTRYMGTWYYAAPEQVGYGMTASSPKTDVYAMGILLNVMLTGKFPKEARADGQIWKVIERCISLKAEERYTVREVLEELERIRKNIEDAEGCI